MNRLQRLFGIAVVTLAWCLVASLPTSAAGPQREGRKLHGELVLLKGSTNRFRLVGENGTYTAKPEMIAPLDGKPVEVELGADGKVQSIREVSFEIEPIQHGFEVVAGQLQVVDAEQGKFGIAGDSRVWVAPSGEAIAPLAGRNVELRLSEDGAITQLRVVGDAPAPKSCSYAGEPRTHGSIVCEGNKQLRCEDGNWIDLAIACAPAAPRGCQLADADLPEGASICRGGKAQRCREGQWVETGEPCAP